MKKLLYAVICYLTFASMISHAMDSSQRLLSVSNPVFKNILSIKSAVFLKPNIIALGSDEAIHVFNDTNQRCLNLRWPHGTAHNIITNGDKTKVGFFCRNSFLVYDTITTEPIWSYSTPNKDNYSASFSAVDDTIFVCQNEQLITNKKSSYICLPFVGTNNHFSIACHPKENKILYPNSNERLSVKQLATGQITDYNPTINIPYVSQSARYVSDSIRSAMYSPDGNYIAILTDKKKTFIYNPTTNNTEPIDCDCECTNLAFLPHSSLIAIVCSDNTIRYYNFIKVSHIATAALSAPLPLVPVQNILINTLDFSPDGTQYVTVINNMCFIGNIPFNAIKEKSFSVYCLLKKYSQQNYYLPLEIVQLFIKKLFDFHKL